MRRYLAAGIWLLLTVTATLMVWEAVSFVAAAVTDRPAPVVAQREVVVALKDGSSTSTTTTLPATGPRSVPPLAATSPGAGSTSPTTASGVLTGPVTGTIGPVTATTKPVAPPPTRVTVPPPTTTVAPSGATATYSTAGGVVAVACTGAGTIRLVAALPDDGFQVFVFSGGPSFVAVSFLGKGHSYPVGAVCVFGQPFSRLPAARK